MWPKGVSILIDTVPFAEVVIFPRRYSPRWDQFANYASRALGLIRRTHIFDDLWFLVVGLRKSVSTTLWTLCLLSVCSYVVSVTIRHVVSDNPVLVHRWPEYNLYVGSVHQTILTVIQVITLDAWASDIARPVMDLGQPGMPVILVMSIVVLGMGLLHFILGFMIERVSTIKDLWELKYGGRLLDAEFQIHELLNKEIWKIRNADDGRIPVDKFETLLRTPSPGRKLKLLGITIEEAISLFEALDVENNLAVPFATLTEGLRRLRSIALGQDVVSLTSFAVKKKLHAEMCLEKVRYMTGKVDRVQRCLDTMGAKLLKEAELRQYFKTREAEVSRQGISRAGVLGMIRHTGTAFPPVVNYGED